MEKEFRALLLADSGVSALVGTRIDWGARPQGAPLPAIVLHTVSDVSGHTLDGPWALTTGRVQVDCYADSYGAAKALGRAVRAALDGTRSGNINAVFYQNSRDGREGGTNEADRPFRVSMDFLVNYQL
ncbi:DUF3168 domain-containing protein [Pontibaca salina]|uniref:DUF3168 domain-containing protein n=1 Tax=Pontibaca salina TaxID=2795731 RepID=A0A934HMY5_9RHOB|nr:DUF3168 domain-containing protein [Pontibaca salina]MBI6628327.1 DUF3168 domain-containing protein [Pontibaca salina]